MNAIILAGGQGARLWPLSTPALPKQFIKLQHWSCYQGTLLRARELASAIFVVAPEIYRDYAQVQAVEVGVEIQFLPEPASRGTAPAIMWGCAILAALQKPTEPVIIFPADHYFADVEVFVKTVRGLPPVPPSIIVALSIHADDTLDCTQFGNMRIEKSGPLHEVKEFIEKPNSQVVQHWHATSEDWTHRLNTGIFLSTPQTILSWTWNLCSAVGMATYDRETYTSLPVLSFDREILMKISCSYASRECLRTADIGDCGWSDLGTWDALKKVMPDEVEKYLLISGHQQTENSEGAPLVTLQDKRPWGWFQVLHEEPGKKIKLLCLNPGEETSLQSHTYRVEQWKCLSGSGRAEIHTKAPSVLTHILFARSYDLFVERGAKHRLFNTSDVPLHILEIQTGDYLGEDDIVRYEDKYGRIV